MKRSTRSLLKDAILVSITTLVASAGGFAAALVVPHEEVGEVRAVGSLGPARVELEQSFVS